MGGEVGTDVEMGTEESFTQGWPWWARAAVYFGFPTIVAMFFMWEAHRFVEKFSEVTPKDLQAKLVMHAQDMTDLKWDLWYANQQQSSMIRANCVNNARNEEQRERCIYGLSEDQAKKVRLPDANPSTEYQFKNRGVAK